MRTGRRLRALRHHRSWTQQDVADRAKESQDVVSRLERGRLDDMPLRRLRSVARALDADVAVFLRWRGGDLDRLVDEGHATLVGRIVALLTAAGWDTQAEVSYSVYGERGSIDVLAWHAATRTLLVIEVKTELTSVEETLRKHDEKTRLAGRIAAERFGWRAVATGRVLVLPDLSTARRRVRRHALVLDTAYPVRSAELRRWLRAPRSLPVSGLLFLSPTHGARRGRGPINRKRVYRRQPRTRCVNGG